MSQPSSLVVIPVNYGVTAKHIVSQKQECTCNTVGLDIPGSPYPKTPVNRKCIFPDPIIDEEDHDPARSNKHTDSKPGNVRPWSGRVRYALHCVVLLQTEAL